MTFLVTSEKNSFLATRKSVHEQFSIKTSANATHLNLDTRCTANAEQRGTEGEVRNMTES